MRCALAIPLVLALLPFAVPAQAQEDDRCVVCRPLISADAGVLHTEAVTEPELTAGSFVGMALPLPQTHAFGLVSLQPLDDWG